ncbi:DUF3169 family protein [Virgibacillus sp. NKC19-16]|nr:DUF3169 family protein [Virgibacillus sp. NKC19-16]
MSIFRYQQIKSLNKQNFSGEEEDGVENRKYKMFSDYALCTHVSFVFSILALSLSLIVTQNVIMIIVSVIVLIITFFLGNYMSHFAQLVYPERTVTPSTSKPDAESVLDVADDGEKYVILDGLFKSQSLLNFSLFFAIAFSVTYSITTNDSEIFSIILMAIVLLVVNVKYQLVVRNK